MAVTERVALVPRGIVPFWAGIVLDTLNQRPASMAAAGIASLPWRPFLVLSGGGALLWAVYMVGLGWVTGSATGLPTWASAAVGMVLGTLAGLVIAGVIAVRRRSREG